MIEKKTTLKLNYKYKLDVLNLQALLLILWNHYPLWGTHLCVNLVNLVGQMNIPVMSVCYLRIQNSQEN